MAFTDSTGNRVDLDEARRRTNRRRRRRRENAGPRPGVSPVQPSSVEDRRDWEAKRDAPPPVSPVQPSSIDRRRLWEAAQSERDGSNVDQHVEQARSLASATDDDDGSPFSNALDSVTPGFRDAVDAIKEGASLTAGFGTPGGDEEDARPRFDPATSPEEVAEDAATYALSGASAAPGVGLAGSTAARMAPRAAQALSRGAQGTSRAVAGNASARALTGARMAGDSARRTAQRLSNEARFQLWRGAVVAGSGGTAGTGVSQLARRSGGRGDMARRVATSPARGARAGVRGATRMGGRAGSPAFLPVSGTVPGDERVRNIGTAPYQLGRATAEDLGGMAEASARSAQEMVAGIPQAAYMAATDPVGLGEMAVEDIEKRWGPLYEGDTEEFRRIAQEEGLTPYALDSMIAATPASAAIGRGMRAGTFGARAQDWMNAPRTPRQATPNVQQTPRTSRGVIGRAAQRGSDRLAQRRTRTRASTGDFLARQALDQGGVIPGGLPFRRGRVMRLEGAARPKSQGRLAQMSEQIRMTGRGKQAIGRTIGPPIARQLAEMDSEQRGAVKYALQFDIQTSDQARNVLPRQMDLIRRAREAEGSGRTFGRWNELPQIQRVIENADDIFTPDFAQRVAEIRRLEKRAVGGPQKGATRSASSDPGLVREQAATRRYQPMAETLGVERLEGETTDAWIGRVRDVARAEGIGDNPGYFPSEQSRLKRVAEYAAGGLKAANIPKRYSGVLFRMGVENWDPTVLKNGIARSIKRKHNWRLVNDIYERNSPEWGRNKPIQELQRELAEKGISEDKVDFVNPRMVREREAQASEGQGRAVADEIMQDAEILQAMQHGRWRPVEGSGAGQTPPVEYTQSGGWAVVPRQVTEELESGMQAKILGRLADIGIEKAQRWILAFNTGWLGFQTVSNLVQAGIGGAGPLSIVRGGAALSDPNAEILGGMNQRSALRNLSPEQRDQVRAALGMSMSGQMREQTRLGATARGRGKYFEGAANAIDYFRESRVGQAMSRNNPIERWYQLAHFSDNLPRQGFVYNRARREAFENMDRSAKNLWGMQDRIKHMMDLDPEGRVSALLRDPKVLERYTRELNEFMGDYTAFTALERSALKRFVPFYSWMRFSLRFAFYTLPTRHPALTGLAYTMGGLGAEEIKDFLGGDELQWALGKVITEGGNSIDAYRGNPVMNAVSEMEGIEDVGNMFSPFLASVAEQVTGQDFFTGDPFLVEGETTPREFVDQGAENRLRIAINQVAGLTTPFRVWSEAEEGGRPVGADSLPWDVRETEYKDQSISQEGQQEFEEQGGALGILERRFAPFIPYDASNLPEIAEYVRDETERERSRIDDSPTTAPSSSSGTFDRNSLWGVDGGSNEFDRNSLWGVE